MERKRSRAWSMVVLSLVTVAVLALTASPAAAKPDASVTTKAKIALLADENVHGTAINVDTIDGRVTLHGDVGTTAEKAAADRIVRGIEGVKSVNNMIEVVPRPTAKSDRGDEEVRKAVDSALATDHALKGANVHVSAVKDGIVTLDGNVPTMTAHARALQTAFRVPGVVGVRSDIDAPDVLSDAEMFARGPNGNERTGVNSDGGNIKGDAHPGPTAESDTRTGAVVTDRTPPAQPSTATDTATEMVQDMWITTATKLRLIGNEQTPALDINVDTVHGEVTLFGMVPTDAARIAAGNEAKAVDGVVRVTNELQVVPEKQQEHVAAADSELKSAIETNCDARTDLKDDAIDVEVSNGVARLTGTVDSGSDRMEALTCARAVPGVRSAIDDLHIEQDTNAKAS